MAADTTQLGLKRPDDGQTGWGAHMRTNATTLDAWANCHVGSTKPTIPGPYLWVQTGLGSSGADATFWIEDGT